MEAQENNTPGIENKNIRYTKEAVFIRLQSPIEQPFELKEVKIRHMTTKDYRSLENQEGSRHEQFELLQKLSGLSDYEIDAMKPVDIGTCLGVVKSFLHGIQVPQLKSMLSSSTFLGESLQVN